MFIPEEDNEEIEEGQEELDEGTEESALDPEKEPWQEIEGEQAPVDPASVVPVGKYVDLKRKLRGKIDDKDERIKALEAKLDSSSSKPSQPLRDVMPLELEYDDPKEYQKACDAYFDHKTTRLVEQTEQKRKTQANMSKIDSGLNAHYGRAQALMGGSGISEEKYAQAETKVRNVIENAYGPQGKNAADLLITQIGKDSEKIVYYIGNNATKLNELSQAFVDDPTGMKAAVLIGSLKGKITKTIKPRSNAPPPASMSTGGTTPGSGVVNGDEGVLKKKYNALIAKNKVQEAYNVKQTGSKQGFNTSTW